MLFQLPLVPTAIYSNSNVISTAMHSLVVSAALNWPVSTSGGSQAASYHAMQPASVAKQQRQHVMWTQVAAAAAAGTDARQQHGRLVAAPAARPSAVVKAAAAEPQEDEGMEEEWVEVGRIGPPHGVRGEMKVQPLTDFPEDRLGEPGPRWLQAPAPKIGRRKAPRPDEVELEWGRSMISKGNEVWLVKLEGVDSPEEAAELRGHTLLIPASAREPLEDEDEFYVQDLVGLRVVLQATREEIGRVSDVFDGTGTHDVLRIQLTSAMLEQLAAAAADPSSSGSGSSEADEEEEEEEAATAGGAGRQRHVLLPFAKAMVPVVDLKAGVMEVAPPEGLLELAAPSNMRRQRRENRGRRERRRTRPKGHGAAQSGAAAGPVGSAPLHSDAE